MALGRFGVFMRLRNKGLYRGYIGLYCIIGLYFARGPRMYLVQRFWVKGLGLRVKGFRCRTEGSEFYLGFRV